MKVSELAKSLNITSDTVRFYTRNGFLNPSKGLYNGYKEYSTQDKARLHFIVNARQLGFSVKDIEQILQHAKDQGSACPIVRQLIEQRLQQTEAQFQQIKQLRQRMKEAIEQWQSLPDQTSSGEMICHLIDSFAESTSIQTANAQTDAQKIGIL